MNKHYQSAAQRLHEFATEGADCTEAELRVELEAQGVNVETFFARLGREAGIKPAKKPTASERLRAVASHAGDKMKGLLTGLNPSGTAEMPVAAYGRSGRSNKRARASSRGKRDGKTSD